MAKATAIWELFQEDQQSSGRTFQLINKMSIAEVDYSSESGDISGLSSWRVSALSEEFAKIEMIVSLRKPA
jgi:hypothetical protein